MISYAAMRVRARASATLLIIKELKKPRKMNEMNGKQTFKIF